MKAWRHGDLLPRKDKQFLIEEDSKWKGPESHERTPGELEAKKFFDDEDKANVQRQLGALRTQQVQAVATRMASPAVTLPMGSSYGGYPFYVPLPAAAPVYAPMPEAAAPVLASAVASGSYAAHVGYGQLQGWNYGQTPLSAPGLGRAALVPMVGHTIPNDIMKAFERDDKDWKPVMKKVNCVACSVALPLQPAVAIINHVVRAHAAVTSARATIPATRRAALVAAVATGIPGDVVMGGGSSGYASYWGGYGAPVENGGFAGVEAPLPLGPGGVLVPGAGANGMMGGSYWHQAGVNGVFSTALPATGGVVRGRHANTLSTTTVTAPSSISAAAAIPTVHVDTWSPGNPHSRRNAPPQGTKRFTASVEGVVADGNAASAPPTAGAQGVDHPSLRVLPGLKKAQGSEEFAVVDPSAAALSGARSAADEVHSIRTVRTAPRAGDWKSLLKTHESRKNNALARMEARAASQGGFVVDAPQSPQPQQQLPREPLSQQQLAAPLPSYGSIPVMDDGISQTNRTAAPLLNAMWQHMAQAPQQQLAQQRTQQQLQQGNAMGQALIDTVAAMVERKVAGDLHESNKRGPQRALAQPSALRVGADSQELNCMRDAGVRR